MRLQNTKFKQRLWSYYRAKGINFQLETLGLGLFLGRRPKISGRKIENLREN
jgi:hypothetical protein